METQLWAIAIRGDASLENVKSNVSPLASVFPFKVPAQGLRIGTLDSLMSLSDDLTKMDVLADATVTKMYKQLQELKPDGDCPTIIGVPAVMYTTMQWEWDEAKFQLKTPLRELCETISMRISALDDELKLKVTEINTLKANLQGMERKTQGNLMVRGLADLVNHSDIIETEYMTTTFIVVPKSNMKEFEAQYHKMAIYVVPYSGRLLSEDVEYALYVVVLFRKSLDEFKASAREKRYTMREFTYDPSALDADRKKKDADSAEYARLKSMLINWCTVNYAEVYTMMLHLKAVRIFSEGVLRYGLTTNYAQGMTPNFKAFLLHPKKGQTEKLRKILGALYSTGGVGGDGEEETVVPGATGEFYPYVYTPIETEPNIAA